MNTSASEPLIDPSLITVGAILRTRDGRKARIICTDRKHGLFPVVALMEESNEEVLLALSEDGSHCKDKSDSRYDLVGVWMGPAKWNWITTPPWINWIAKTKKHGWILTSERPIRGSDDWIYGSCIYVPQDFQPKWDGPWQDSLTERPTP